MCSMELENQYWSSIRCFSCFDEWKRGKDKEKKRLKAIKSGNKKPVDNRVKNTSRKISSLVKERVYKRDNGKCVFCNCYTSDHFHHAFWWAEANYKSTRNNTNQLILLCNSCHHDTHFSSKSKELREKGKEYLSYIYNNKTYVL